MDTTEPRGSDAEIVALLRACGMDEANLDDGVRNVREIVRKKTAAARGTEPLDLDLIDDLHARATTWSASAEVRATLAIVPLLTAEVRRLREDRLAAIEKAILAVHLYTPVHVAAGIVHIPRKAVVAEMRRIAEDSA